MTVTLYGAPLSLYTGRARSYLIKAGIDYRETPPISDHYEDVVLAKAGGRRSMPTVELADGRVIRDSVAIVDHFEAELGGRGVESVGLADDQSRRVFTCQVVRGDFGRSGLLAICVGLPERTADRRLLITILMWKTRT